MKTRGQRLYEYQNPERIAVVRWGHHHFATFNDILMVKNPEEPTPWRFLTKACQEGWEKTAEGHNLFSGENA